MQLCFAACEGIKALVGLVQMPLKIRAGSAQSGMSLLPGSLLFL
jgi:hypothetical protein